MQAELEKFIVHVNYDNESKEKGLIKFIPNEGEKEIVISADDLLDLIANHVQGRGVAVDLKGIDRQNIWMMQVERAIRIKAPKAYEEGETIDLNITHPYPVLLYAAEKAFNTCKQGADTKFYAIEEGVLTKEMEEAAKANLGFVNHFLNLNKEQPTEEEAKS